MTSKEIKNPLYNSNDDDCEHEPTIPIQFDYSGSIIFISNKYKHQLDPAILTRVLKADLYLTLEDTFKRIETLLPFVNGNKPATMEEKKTAFEYMKELIRDIDSSKLDICIRSYVDVLDMMLHGSKDWKRLALQQCLK